MPEVVTYLEMTSVDQLCPAPGNNAVRLEPVDSFSSILRDVVTRVGAPHDWRSARYSIEEWQQAMREPGLRHWLIMVGDNTVGVVGLHAERDGEVELTAFGLVPESVGHGYGGVALTEAIRLAWTQESPAADPVRRVWLHTSSLDHPHALSNYVRRGFRVFRTETR